MPTAQATSRLCGHASRQQRPIIELENESRLIAGRRRKRWVIYDGVVEASRVPPEWDSWLHYTTDVVPPAGGSARKTWQKEHEPNLTGTDHAYRPPGHTLVIGDKPKPPYEAWRPG